MTPLALRPAQAAEQLGVSPATLWRWCKEIPSFPRPRKLTSKVTVFDSEEIRDWVRKQPASIDARQAA